MPVLSSAERGNNFPGASTVHSSRLTARCRLILLSFCLADFVEKIFERKLVYM